jgi:hypothetical protein
MFNHVQSDYSRWFNSEPFNGIINANTVSTVSFSTVFKPTIIAPAGTRNQDCQLLVPGYDVVCV